MKSKQNPPSQTWCRRPFLSLLLMAVCALAGCEKSNVPAAKPGADAKPGGAGAPPAPIVTIYTWDQYLDPSLAEEFHKRTGITVEVKIYESSDEMMEGLKSYPGAYDLFISEDGYLPKVVSKRLAKKLDKSRLANWKNLDPSHTDQPFDPKNEFTVPYLWGTTLLAYRKDLLPNPKKSWSIVFEPELKDHISFLDDRMECYAGILRTMGINLPDASPEDISKAADALLMLVKEQNLCFGGESGNEVKEHLLNGKSWVSMIYSGDAAKIAEENPGVPIGYFIPEEGATVWTDCFCISQDTTRLDNAYKFLDFMLEAKSAASSANYLRYASPNKEAAQFIDADLLADETINPRPEVLAKCRYFKLRDIDSLRMVHTGWRRVWDAWLQRTQQVDATESKTAPGEAPPSTIN